MHLLVVSLVINRQYMVMDHLKNACVCVCVCMCMNVLSSPPPFVYLFQSFKFQVLFSEAVSDVCTVQIATASFPEGVTKLQETSHLLANLTLCTDSSTLDFLIHTFYRNSFCHKMSESLQGMCNGFAENEGGGICGNISMNLS